MRDRTSDFASGNQRAGNEAIISDRGISFPLVPRPEKLFLPEVGELVWDEYSWEGWIRLPIFTTGKPPSESARYPLSLISDGDIRENQLQAIRFLLRHEAIIALGVLVALREHVRRTVTHQEGWVPTSLWGLSRATRLVHVCLGLEEVESLQIAFEYQTDWMPEGVGILMQGARFVGYDESEAIGG